MNGLDFGVLLKAHRAAAGLTQEQLAEKTGLSPQAIGLLERGERKVPQAGTLELLVTALRLTGEAHAEFLAAATLRRDRPSGVPVPAATWIEEAADSLAGGVLAQWESEAAIRQLRDPLPLDVRWAPAAAELGDSEETIRGVARSRSRRLSLQGGAGQVVEAFRDLLLPRLVVLGQPGSGKTGLLVLLTIGLLRDRRPGPIPVLLSLSSWDARRQDFHAWARERLYREHPRLASHGRAAAGELLLRRRVLPVLDGLDELPERLRSRALTELARLGPDYPLVIACRSREYQQAVAAGGLVRAASVVELEELEPAAIIPYLKEAKSFVSAPARWEPVFAELRGHPHGALAAALSTPLMVSLARTIYERGPADPSELLDRQRYASAGVIEDHLLDALVPTVFSADPPAGDARRRWRADEARRWLTFLASRLQERDTRELAWWDLSPWRPAATPLLCIACTALFAAAGWWLGTAYSLLLMAVGGCGFGLMIGFLDERWVVRMAAPLDRQVGATLLGGLGSGLRLGLLLTLGVGGMFGLLAALMSRLWVWLFAILLLSAALTLPVCLAWGLGSALVRALVRTTGELVSPKAALRSDRTGLALTVAATVLGVGLVELTLGLVPLITGWVLTGLHVGVRPPVNVAGPVRALLEPFALVGLATIVAVYPWPKYQTARAWFAATGRLPWRLMRFLDDAHQLNVLRQVGAVYEFRHVRLQERLAGDVQPVERMWPSERTRNRARSVLERLRLRRRAA